MKISIIGPTTSRINGSLLRALNIWYALTFLHPKYVPIKSIADLVRFPRSILKADLALVSGTNTWTSATIAILRKLLRRITIVDVHGFAWYEAYLTKSSLLMRVLSLISEKLSYRLATSLIVASKFLRYSIHKWIGINPSKIHVVENALTPLFEKAYNALSRYDKRELRLFLNRELGIPVNKTLIVAPLPDVFRSNVEALKEIEHIELKDDWVVVITGTHQKSVKGTISLGYIPYIHYIALLLASDGVLLPYPSSAICGGIRNKVLEAMYCNAPIITSKTGVMHIEAIPYVHYLPVEKLEMIRDKDLIEDIRVNEVALVRKYTFEKFKMSYLRAIFLVMKMLQILDTKVGAKLKV